jgi:serine/threonine protein kinase
MKPNPKELQQQTEGTLHDSTLGQTPPGQATELHPSSLRQTMPVVIAPLNTIANYVIEGELGRGGMGVVYKARQKGLHRLVALKMILHAGHASAEQRERFRREAEALAKLRHENIVQVIEIGEH